MTPQPDSLTDVPQAEPALRLDCRGLICPLPVLRARKALAGLPGAAILEVLATDPGAPRDMAAFCRETGHTLVSVHTEPAPDGATDTRPVSVLRIARA